MPRPAIWGKDTILARIMSFIEQEKRIPTYRDFRDQIAGLPGPGIIRRYWRTTNEAIQEAGYTPLPQKSRSTQRHPWRRQINAYKAAKEE